jgi:hypothetical protein
MKNTDGKFRVEIINPGLGWYSAYFQRFWTHCRDKAQANDWNPVTVANYELKPQGGRLIQTKTGGWYLRWDSEANHTMFVLRWT